MEISYIAPKAVETTNKGMIQKAVEDAINNTIVHPFCNWVHNTTLKGVALLEWGLIFACASSIIFYICGEKKGKKVAIKCVLIYIGLEIVKVVFL